MTLSLVSTTSGGASSLFAVLGLAPGADVAPARIVGALQAASDGPRFSTFQRNGAFVAAYVRYMRGELTAKPEILQKARVKPGQHVYVIDPRTPTPDGDVPWRDIVGWYQSDDAGKPRAKTFTYNGEHELVTKEGRWSRVLDDASLVASLGAAELG
jgi:hypothetical protein